MTARQFLLQESDRCRREAARCTDKYVAAELLRLAERFEQEAGVVPVDSKTDGWDDRSAA